MKRIPLSLFLMFGISACESEEPVPKGEPTIEHGRFHVSVSEETALMKGERAVWRANVTSGYIKPNSQSQPSSVSWLPVMGSCSPPQPGQGAKISFIHTGSSFAKLPMFTIDNKDLGKRAEEFVRMWRAKGKWPGYPSGLGEDRFSVSNIYINDAQNSHFLVLSSNSKMLWNLVLAPDVKVDGVVLLAPGGAGIANLPDGVKVASLGASALRNCRIRPMVPVHSMSGVVRRATTGDASSREAIASLRKTYNDFADWFRASFGSSLSEVTIGGERLHEVLIGSVPVSSDRRIPYRGMKGAKLHLMQSDHFLYGSDFEYHRKSNEIIEPIASRLAGGSLSNLDKR